MRYLILSLLACALAAAEPTKLPADAQAAIDKAAKAEADITVKAQADILKIRQGLLPILTKAQEAATKKGDLEGALLVKARVEELRAAVSASAPKPVLPPGPAETLMGKWIVKWGASSLIWNFDRDGTCTAGNHDGKWKIIGREVQVTWNHGPVETVSIPPTGKNNTTGQGFSGASLFFSRP